MCFVAYFQHSELAQGQLCRLRQMLRLRWKWTKILYIVRERKMSTHSLHIIHNPIPIHSSPQSSLLPLASIGPCAKMHALLVTSVCAWAAQWRPFWWMWALTVPLCRSFPSETALVVTQPIWNSPPGTRDRENSLEFSTKAWGVKTH